MDDDVKDIRVRENPVAALDAVSSPMPLTIAQLAILEKLESPVFKGDISNLGKTLVAVWAVNAPVRDVMRNLDRADACAIEWAEKMGAEEYNERLCDLLDGIREFWAMLPRPEKKKEATSGTDGSQS